MARRREVPEPWKTLMDQHSISSIRQLSQKSGVSAPAISRLMHREGRQEDDTIVRVATTLGMDLDKAYGLAGVTAPEAKPYTPPAEAHRLNERQRKAIDELIRATVADLQEQEAGDGSERSATPMNQAGGNPAPDDGIGAFGHRDRGDLDHESVNDGAGDNVHPLRPDFENMAAYDTGKESEKQRMLREEAEREQESQDPDDY